MLFVVRYPGLSAVGLTAMIKSRLGYYILHLYLVCFGSAALPRLSLPTQLQPSSKKLPIDVPMASRPAFGPSITNGTSGLVKLQGKFELAVAKS